MYSKGYSLPFVCPVCDGWVPSYSVYEKEVWENGLLPYERVCDCGAYEAIRDEMLAVFHHSRVEALRRFRATAARLHLPDPDARPR